MSYDKIRNGLVDMVTEAMKLRKDAALPAPGAAPADLSLSLLDVRQRLDRVEELYAKSMRTRGYVHRYAASENAQVDDAWDQALMARRSGVVRDEYASAKERHAEANLAVLDQRRSARRLTELAGECDEAVDVLRLTYRGLDGVRQDLLALLRATAFESHLER